MTKSLRGPDDLALKTRSPYLNAITKNDFEDFLFYSTKSLLSSCDSLKILLELLAALTSLSSHLYFITKKRA